MEKRWWVLGITSVGVFMSSLDLFIVNIAFPDIQAEFAGTSLGDLSWILNAYAIVFAALLVPAGRVADRIGRKRVFIAGLVLFGLASASCAAADSVPVLVAARVVQAAGGAMMLPSSLGLVLPSFPPEQRTVAVSIWSAVGGVAAALGPPIGGMLVEASWRWIFIVNVPIALLTVAAALLLLDEVRDPDRGSRPDALGALLLIGAVATLTTGIVEGPEWGWADPRVIGCFVAALVLGTAFFRRSATHEAPIIEMPLLRVRTFATANVATMTFFAGFAAMLLAGVLLLTQVWGYTEIKAGFALVPGPAMAALFAMLSPRFSSRIGLPRTAALGGLAIAGSFAFLIPQIDAVPEYASVFLPGFMLGGVGVGLLVSTLPAMVTASLPAERLATGTGVFGMSRQLGSALGVAILIALLADPTPADLLDGLRRGWYFMAGTGVVTAMIALTIPAARPGREAAAEAVAAEAEASAGVA